MFRWITGVAVGVALMILAAGCGGGGSGDSSTNEVTKAVFTKQANAICVKGTKERKAAYEKYSEELQARSNAEKVTHALERQLATKMVKEKVVPSLKDQVAQLEELEAPSADEEKISTMLHSLSQGSREVEDGGVRQLVKGGKLVIFQEEAEGYGLTCSIF